MLLLLLGCLDHTPIPGAEGAFVAMQADFEGYSTWDSVGVEAASADDTGHPEGERTVYVNTMPAAEDTTFAVGTIVVKVIPGADIHAMVKRGDGFNADGAPGWEWFELVTATNGEPVIKWRGAEPPDGETYGALPGATEDTAVTMTGDCNACHAAAADNDFVHAVPLAAE